MSSIIVPIGATVAFTDPESVSALDNAEYFAVTSDSQVIVGTFITQEKTVIAIDGASVETSHEVIASIAVPPGLTILKKRPEHLVGIDRKAKVYMTKIQRPSTS